MENPCTVIPVNLLLLQGKIGEAMGFLVEFPGGVELPVQFCCGNYSPPATCLRKVGLSDPHWEMVGYNLYYERAP